MTVQDIFFLPFIFFPYYVSAHLFPVEYAYEFKTCQRFKNFVSLPGLVSFPGTGAS